MKNNEPDKRFLVTQLGRVYYMILCYKYSITGYDYLRLGTSRVNESRRLRYN